MERDGQVSPLGPLAGTTPHLRGPPPPRPPRLTAEPGPGLTPLSPQGPPGAAAAAAAMAAVWQQVLAVDAR